MFLLKNNCVAYPRNPYESFFALLFEKMIVSQTRKIPAQVFFALHFEQWMCHRPSRPPRNPREIFLWKICKCRKHYLLWIFSILMCVRDMFSDNSVNFKLKNSLSISPTNEVWIFMYKFIDFDHFQSIKENDIFYRIMLFLLFLYSFLKFLVADLLLHFLAESIRLLWIKWLKSLFREAENELYYWMLLSLLFSKRMHAVRPKCIWKTRRKFFSFVIHCSIWTLSWLKKP